MLRPVDGLGYFRALVLVGIVYSLVYCAQSIYKVFTYARADAAITGIHHKPANGHSSGPIETIEYEFTTPTGRNITGSGVVESDGFTIGDRIQIYYSLRTPSEWQGYSPIWNGVGSLIGVLVLVAIFLGLVYLSKSLEPRGPPEKLPVRSKESVP